jgi:cell division protein FtsW (lipid II flippase)
MAATVSKIIAAATKTKTNAAMIMAMTAAMIAVHVTWNYGEVMEATPSDVTLELITHTAPWE